MSTLHDHCNLGCSLAGLVLAHNHLVAVVQTIRLLEDRGAMKATEHVNREIVYVIWMGDWAEGVAERGTVLLVVTADANDMCAQTNWILSVRNDELKG